MNTIIYAKGIIDGTGRDIKNDVAIFIKGKIITDIKHNFTIENKDVNNYNVIDLTHNYLLPGFVDSHSHGPTRPGEGDQISQNKVSPIISTLRSVKNLNTSINSGVTTMRIMNANDDLDVYLRQGVNAKEIVGPRLFISGGALKPTSPGSYNYVDSPDDIKKSIKNSVKKDAEVIKIFCDPGNYTRDEIRLAIEEAHQHNLPISAHALTEKEIRICVEEGVDSIEHGGEISDDILDLMSEKGVFWVATNSIFYHPSGLPNVDYTISAKGTNQAEKEKKLLLNAAHQIEKHIKKGIYKNVKFACGTDSMHGLFPFEIEYLVKNGLTPLEAIKAATKNGAELLRADDYLGTLEIGKQADIISVPENPLENISTLWDVNFVMKEGSIIKNKRGCKL